MPCAADFFDELTDWHNVLQGGLGSLIGSMLGVLGAFLAALLTITSQRRNDRALAREMAGVAGATRITAALRHLARSLTAIRVSREVGSGMPIHRVRELLSEPAETFGLVIDQEGALIPRELADPLHSIYAGASILVGDEVLYELSSSVMQLTALDKMMSDANRSLYRYRQDPIGESRRLSREARQARKKEERAKKGRGHQESGPGQAAPRPGE
jgi:hypothetical protein